ncbi:hypothetical protein M413DRAFT_443955 [Hebeloma cylindrosporum]|uniref:Uncharacterized protein n=1 Tax=Hebeloma cylindrosporum TaxID=76867 RepID=A0A0C3CHT4_HEBCY|nr:hypothetical protein M413DRAFT_443955 [Hebeloma cylindrosporum h7]
MGLTAVSHRLHRWIATIPQYPFQLLHVNSSDMVPPVGRFRGFEYNLVPSDETADREEKYSTMI